ncbi:MULTISPECIES: hypothetical protein [unclassified Thioalkalivibrio]|uniref:hypothetical protein n=1 Tax=unclassified Thioalkalivibrio TaxID=2621013 RepID=UPI000373465D|nr:MULTISPECIES: hypothetical protein [unclassified Thioalkalivibrio]
MTYLSSAELAEKLHLNPRYVNNVLRHECLSEGRHYVRPFGRRKVLYIWETIEEDMFTDAVAATPMANGGKTNG